MPEDTPSMVYGGCLAGLRVLIAEDEWLLADTLSVHLEEEGAQTVGPCPTAAEAIRMLISKPVDAAIVDMNLKDSFSDPLISRLVEMDIPFVILTGYMSLPSNADERAVQVLHKPVDRKKLIRLLSNLARGRATGT
jgi:two-component SAPR family response regulator